MEEKNIYTAVARALVGHGLSPDDALSMVQMTKSRQGAEWEDILSRCSRNETSHIYLVATRVEEVLSVVVYAPAEKDNIRHVMDFLSQGPIGADAPEFMYYPVSSFDVGSAVKKAVALELARERVLRENDAYLA